MKRKPRCRGGEETGECAAELEVMVMVMLVVVITMFCSSSAPLSLTHTLSFSLSSPLSVSLLVGVQNKSFTTHQKPCFNLARDIASLDDIMLTSPLG